ncbi:MFS general substrate transporter [Mycena alexandri]|uniref:MFS general substrate transporter n=1 Tax=Mycena alexandri TaxID=1745969 RepID=A0AAD6STP3_9AGAR|nr:MFS general substrate transporter [Mycena alexandri]
MELSTGGIGPSRPATLASESLKTLDVKPSLPANNAEFIMMRNLNPSAVSAPGNNDSASHISSAGTHVLRARLQLGAIYWSMFLAGWNDGTSGPLIPRMQRVYHASFLIVSLVFVVSSVGFISGAAINMHWTDKVGFGRLMVLGAVCQVAAYSIQAPAPPFPVFAASFFLNGLAISIQNAQANAYVASLRFNSEMYMGMLHASYGAGALCSPLVATRFAQMDHWSFHYLVSLGIAVINAPGDTSPSDRSNFRQILSLKSVHILGFFALMYVGVEVTIGGWITTYLIDVRGAGPSAGYTTSGFFAGIMVGRLALLWLNKKIGERRVLYLYVALAMGLEFIVWFVPSFIGGAVAVSLVGLFFGPMYPLIMNSVGRSVPRWLLSGSIGWVAGLGQAGSAILPFVTGAIASKTGIRTLQPLLISLMAMFPILWALVPNSPQRID